MVELATVNSKYSVNTCILHDENPSLAGKNPDFILSALLDSWALILK